MQEHPVNACSDLMSEQLHAVANPFDKKKTNKQTNKKHKSNMPGSLKIRQSLFCCCSLCAGGIAIFSPFKLSFNTRMSF